MSKQKRKLMKFDIFLKGKFVNLVVVNEKIMAKTEWYTWLNDQTITKFTKQGYFPVTKKEEVQYYKDTIKAKKRIQLGVIDKKRNKLIGMLSLYNINHIDGVCDISAIFNKNDKYINSMEFFNEAQTLLINHAFKKLNLRRIEASAYSKPVYEFNKKIFGFRCEGVLKERDFVDGKYVDRMILALMRKDWFNETR